MKFKKEITCPSEDITFTIRYEADDEKELFCPFCQLEISEHEQDLDEEDE